MLEVTRANPGGRLAGWLFALATLTVPAVAAGQDFPKVFVLPTLDLPEGSAKPGAEAITTGLYKELGVSVPITLLKDVDAAAAKMGAAPAAAPTTMPAAKTADDAKALLAEGKKLKAKDAAKAIEVLKAAVASLEALLPEAKDFAALAEAQLELGDAMFRAGFQDEGEERLKTAVSMGWKGSPAGLDGKFAGVLDKRVKKMATKAPGNLKLESTPAAATVLVDGKAPPGPTPFTMEGLAPGLHYVLVTSPGHKPAVEKVEIKGNETTELTVVLEKEGAAPAAAGKDAKKGRLPASIESAVGAGRIGTDARKTMSAFGTAGEAKFVVVTYFVPDGDVYFLRGFFFRVEDGAMVRLPDKVFAALDKMEKGIRETAELVIKYSYAFPDADALDKTSTVIVPRPEVKVASTKRSSSIVEPDDDGVDGEECDPEVDDDCKPKKKKTSTVKKKKKKSSSSSGKKKSSSRSKSKKRLASRDKDDDDDDDDDDKVSRDDDDDDDDDRGPSIKLPTDKWWFWVGVGVVGAAAAGGIAAGVYLGTRDGVNAVVTW